MFKISYERNGQLIVHDIPAPARDGFSISEEKIAKDGSGRNSQTGVMYIEYIGSVKSINVTWDLLPSAADFHRLYNILTHLPPFFTLTYPNMDGNESFDMYCYQNKLTSRGRLFRVGNVMYRALQTTFVQADVTPLSDEEAEL